MRYLLLCCLAMLVATQSFRTPYQFTITGTVIDAASGRPIPQVSINVKGTKEATVTAADGTFSLTISSDKATLVISYIGYDQQEIKVKKDDSRSLVINLKTTSNEMNEVLVQGYISGVAPTNRIRDKKSSGAPASQVRVRGISTLPGKRGEEKLYMYDRAPAPKDEFNREGYDAITENRFLKVTDNPLSTFSIDVDAASYSNVRRILNTGSLPPAGSVRIEEMVNYFKYEYPQPEGNDPFSINTEISECPWNAKHRLVLIGLQGKKIPVENLPSGNLVFLIDVSGSMMDENKLPLVRQSMKLLVDQLREQDKVSIVVYAGNAGLVLPATSGEEKTKIKDAIDRLEAGGSTAGGAGIKLAYKTAKDNFIKEGNNRVILCTDGDFNVGASSDAELEGMIEEERKSGVFLTVLGFGTGNYQDAKMQKLADKGNGNHGYIDNFNEARKVFVNEFGGTLFTIAKDVKLQIEFNPAKVQGYRLIGYENRILNKEDFNNDKKDAGDLGSGHTVTALYEVIPTGVKDSFLESVDKLKYQPEKNNTMISTTGEIMTIKFRYKKPDEDKSKLIEHAVIDEAIAINKTSNNFRFAAGVAEFGMLLLNSEFKSNSTYNNAWTLAKGSVGEDKEGYRNEFLRLLKSAQALAKGGKEIEEEDMSAK